MSRWLVRPPERALERSYRRHVGDVYRYAFAVLTDPVAAEEVTQMTFLNAFLSARRSRAGPQLNALLAIAHDVCRLRGGYPRLDDADIPLEEYETTAADGALTCHQAERAISRQLDDRLPRRERRLLRCHMRFCADCEAFARSQQAQRLALRALAALPLPDTLQSFFGLTRAQLRVRAERKFLPARASP